MPPKYDQPGLHISETNQQALVFYFKRSLPHLFDNRAMPVKKSLSKPPSWRCVSFANISTKFRASYRCFLDRERRNSTPCQFISHTSQNFLWFSVEPNPSLGLRLRWIFSATFCIWYFNQSKNCSFQQKRAFIMVVLYSTAMLVSRQKVNQINKLNSYF